MCHVAVGRTGVDAQGRAAVEHHGAVGRDRGFLLRQGQQAPPRTDGGLAPLRLAAVSDAIAERLADIDPEHAADYTTHATAARTDLVDLDAEFTQGLKTCARRELFVSHSAFGYMAARHDLEQVAVAGISPNVEPSGARIAEVQELARRYGATTMFFETAASDAVAKSIAHDLGLETAVLDPIESVSDKSAGRDYPAIMRANLTAIQKANDCG